MWPLQEANKSSNARAAQEKFVLKVGAFGVLLAVVVGFYLIFSSNMSKDVSRPRRAHAHRNIQLHTGTTCAWA